MSNVILFPNQNIYGFMDKAHVIGVREVFALGLNVTSCEVVERESQKRGRKCATAELSAEASRNKWVIHLAE